MERPEIFSTVVDIRVLVVARVSLEGIQLKLMPLF
jgi:hypothetical protein